MTPPDIEVTPKLKQQLQKIYIKATDPRTPDTYASVLRRKARRLLLLAGETRENWPPWTEDGAAWQNRGDRTQPVRYPPGLPDDVVAELEYHREHNNPAEARALCRALDIPPPRWAVR